jgi:threonine/homoserine/homoserine lactone efflux protein
MVFMISLSGVMAPGPVFAVTLAKGRRNPLAGSLIAFGHGLVELPVILLILFGFTVWLKAGYARLIMEIAGGFVLCWMGHSMFKLARSQIDLEKQDLPYPSLVAGALTTAANPYFFLWWATVGSVLVLKAESLGLLAVILFIVVHLSADFLWCQCVSLASHRLQHVLSGRIQKGLLIMCSLLLFGFGIWFLLDALGIFSLI